VVLGVFLRYLIFYTNPCIYEQIEPSFETFPVDKKAALMMITFDELLSGCTNYMNIGNSTFASHHF